MKALFAPANLDTIEHRQKPKPDMSTQCNVLTHPSKKKDAGFLQLEIRIETLQKLIMNNTLAAEEIHCLNRGSQISYKKLLLNNL